MGSLSPSSSPSPVESSSPTLTLPLQLSKQTPSMTNYISITIIAILVAAATAF
jgi:hypothetical protein